MNNLSPGFTSPLDAQACFRAILDAFSTPGSPVTLTVPLTPPLGLSIAGAAVLLTLTDAHTKVALPIESCAHPWLVFHTGASFVEESEADFCLAHTPSCLPKLRQGTDAEPEASATLILDVEHLNGMNFRLSGPGLKDPVTVELPFGKTFLLDWQAQTNNAPRGVDIILCAGKQILALPRSLHIEEG